jgi:nicotinamide riboside kinase
MGGTKIINLIGAPSSGKTVLAAMLFAELKKMHLSVEYIQEYIKSLIYKEKYNLINNQYYISTKQYELFKSIDNKVDYIVTDGSLFHGLYYNRSYKENVSNIEKTEIKIKEYISEFDNIYIYIKRGNWKYQNEGRIHKENEAEKISKDLRDLMNNQGILFFDFDWVTDNLSDLIKKILDKNN